MNGGKIAAVGLLVATVAAGGGMWYAQEYGYYDSIDPATVTLEVATPAGPQPLTIADVEAIDADSSPLRWRACATVTDLPADAIPFPDATPLIGPRWFDCFDARRIGADLESGAARAVLSVEDIRPDVDRVLAIYPDGRVYGWHQYLDKTPERGVMD
ncbi:DUF6446 family protein [Paracoccus hibiscisoli]|uniref:Histidine kinase n=1 Tax=Paracoccus hibiscisoli TaxID=2023261 RepID=A0A4U0QR48_9RHOB|nr:DUF6446 family protein [Paracoccus hibiscisoli]TJZ83742.1 histidine kinase [Paracoccus hibiscisoli]